MFAYFVNSFITEDSSEVKLAHKIKSRNEESCKCLKKVRTIIKP